MRVTGSETTLTHNILFTRDRSVMISVDGGMSNNASQLEDDDVDGYDAVLEELEQVMLLLLQCLAERVAGLRKTLREKRTRGASEAVQRSLLGELGSLGSGLSESQR